MEEVRHGAPVARQGPVVQEEHLEVDLSRGRRPGRVGGGVKDLFCAPLESEGERQLVW